MASDEMKELFQLLDDEVDSKAAGEFVEAFAKDLEANGIEVTEDVITAMQMIADSYMMITAHFMDKLARGMGRVEPTDAFAFSVQQKSVRRMLDVLAVHEGFLEGIN